MACGTNYRVALTRTSVATSWSGPIESAWLEAGSRGPTGFVITNRASLFGGFPFPVFGADGTIDWIAICDNVS
jgi:hypothetical protein